MKTAKSKNIASMVEAVASKADIKVGQFFGDAIRRIAVDTDRLVLAARAVHKAKDAYYAVDVRDSTGQADALFALANRIDEMEAIAFRLEEGT